MADIHMETVLGWGLAGAIVAAGYLFLLWQCVQRYIQADGRDPVIWLLTASRWLLLAGLVWAAMHWGMPGILAALGGFMLTRSLCLRRMGCGALSSGGSGHD